MNRKAKRKAANGEASAWRNGWKPEKPEDAQKAWAFIDYETNDYLPRNARAIEVIVEKMSVDYHNACLAFDNHDYSRLEDFKKEFAIDYERFLDLLDKKSASLKQIEVAKKWCDVRGLDYDDPRRRKVAAAPVSDTPVEKHGHRQLYIDTFGEVRDYGDPSFHQD